MYRVRPVLTAATLAVAGWLAVTALAAQPASPQTREVWTVLRQDGSQPLPVVRTGGRAYVASGDLAGLLGLTFREDRAGGLVVTGLTGTNVSDVRVVLVD